MMNRSYWIVVIVILYLALAVIYGLVTPIYEGPDEIGHVLYVKHIAEGRGIPVQSREYAIAYGFGQEGSQAPLYYALNAALVRVFGLSLTDLKGLPPSNPFTTCGRPAHYNVARYRHDPRQEAFPYQGAARAVHAMRLLSALLGGATVVAVYAATRLAFPDVEEAALLAAVLMAFNPQFVFMSGVVNNDNLVSCLTAVAVALTLYGLRRGFTWQRVLVLGVVCGLAPLAKLGGLTAPAFAGLGLLADFGSQIANRKSQIANQQIGKSANPQIADRKSPFVHSSIRRFVDSLIRHSPFAIRHCSLFIVSLFIVSGWWFARNWTLYGDPTGTNMMLSIYGGRKGWPARLIVPELLKTFRSYWAAFACELSFPRPVYWAFGLLIGVSVVGWIRRWKAALRWDRGIVALFLLWLGVVAASWVRWNIITYAPLGRLFFQANAVIGALLGYGLARLTSRPRWMLFGVGAGLWALALAGALFVVRPAFALPARYPTPYSPPIGGAGGVPPQPLPQTIFGAEIEVLGYAVSGRSLEPGQTLEVALFLQATRPISEDYALALQLLSPVPGDDTTLVNFNTIPGGGSYPTYAWRPDEVVVDRYRLRVPDRVEQTQAWRVVAIFYRLSGGERLPVAVAGQPAGEMLELGLVRVGEGREGREGTEGRGVPLDAQLETGPVFGEAIRLEGMRVLPEGDRLRVQVWWRAAARLEKDYTALVHLYDTEGTLLAAGDAPPLRGGFPTSLWEPGDLIADEYVLTDDDRARFIGLGWYDPLTGARLPGFEDGNPLPDNTYRLSLMPPP